MPKVSRRPKTLRSFEARFPEVWTAYQALQRACDRSGPLSPKTRELIKIGVEVSRKRHGGLIAHLVRAARAGASKTEIYQAILVAAPLIGLPDVLDAFLAAKKRLG